VVDAAMRASPSGDHARKASASMGLGESGGVSIAEE
jgi:hypothetical protein